VWRALAASAAAAVSNSMPTDRKLRNKCLFTITFWPFLRRISRRFSYRIWPDAEVDEIAIAYVYLTVEVVGIAVLVDKYIGGAVSTTTANEAYVVRSVSFSLCHWENNFFLQPRRIFSKTSNV